MLLTSLLTTTIISFICATSLYVASQNSSSGMQTAIWQQSLSGADTAVDRAIAALNLNSSQGWTNWKTVTSSQLPTTQPSGGSNTTAAPSSTQYNYLVSTSPSSPVSGANSIIEGNASVSSWVTVDTAGLQTQNDPNGNQWYRIRATGIAAIPGLTRVSNNRLDNDLRKISLLFDRKAGGSISSPQATRTIEVIAQPVVKQQPNPTQNVWARAVTTRNGVSMAAGGNSLIADVDSYDSSDSTKSTLGLYDVTKRQNHGDVALVNSTGADLNNTYVYGGLTYSGPAVKNANNVSGAISTPFNATIPDTADPTWTPDHTYAGGSTSPFLSGGVNAGTKANPAHIKIDGDFTVAAAQAVVINTQSLLNTDPNNNYIEFWVTGNFTVAVGGLITQNSAVHATWYVDGNITVSGTSYVNLAVRAANLSFIGVGSGHTVTNSGAGLFYGTINAPGYDVTISGAGGFYGAMIGNTLTLNGLGSIHYDEALKGSIPNPAFTIDHYAFASWIEDNSDKARSITF